MKKQLNYQDNKRVMTLKNQGFLITLPRVELINDVHPHSLRALKPAQEWDIFIDETGSKFCRETHEMNESDPNLGRIIALALPAGHQLPPLTKPTHAADLPYAEVQALLQTLCSHKIGILGATLKDDLNSYNWISATQHLIRWVLLMLPLSNKPTRVRIHIEQRAPYDKDDFLKALQETLDNELKLLLPKRFEPLHATLAIMKKDHPFNGYVDVIANCWGSKDKVKRQLLARTQWRGHCLLQSTETTGIDRIERLYLSISNRTGVSPEDWYELCHACELEPSHSLLHDMLQQLGQYVQKHPGQWQAYLQEIRRRLDDKQYTPGSLRVALEWLEDNRNENAPFPTWLQLQLGSLQLAAGNHEGDSQLDLVDRLLPLTEQLKDEDAGLVCQAVLRIATRSTHLYEFDARQGLLQQWINYPIAVPGLLNHAKLLSSLGQLQAFQGQHASAVSTFDQALCALDRLSDSRQKTSNLHQTRAYQTVVLQDMHHEDALQRTLRRVYEVTGTHGLRGVEKLARSASELRFEHYLLLRMLITQPAITAEQRTAYLGQVNAWQSDDEHPWMLINAYRAWLLHDDGQMASAQTHLDEAIEDSLSANTPMLGWMAHCLFALGQSLGLKHAARNAELQARPPASWYPSHHLPTLAGATEHAQRIATLSQLLPFNFH